MRNQAKNTNKHRDGLEHMDDQADLLDLTSGIVSAYVGNHTVAAADLPALIKRVHVALAAIGEPAEVEAAPQKEPAVSIRRSIAPDYLICL